MQDNVLAGLSAQLAAAVSPASPSGASLLKRVSYVGQFIYTANDACGVGRGKLIEHSVGQDLTVSFAYCFKLQLI